MTSPTALSDGELADKCLDDAHYIAPTGYSHTAELLREAARRLAGREKRYFVCQEDGSLKPLLDEAAITAHARRQFSEEMVKWCEERANEHCAGEEAGYQAAAAHIRRLAGLP